MAVPFLYTIQMKIVPVKNSVICRKMASAGITDVDGVLVGDTSPDMYEVVSFSPDEGFEFMVGDVVLVDGKGDEFETSPGESLYRFNVEKVMCKVA